jgi:hypothetical protein
MTSSLKLLQAESSYRMMNRPGTLNEGCETGKNSWRRRLWWSKKRQPHQRWNRPRISAVKQFLVNCELCSLDV